MQPNDRFKEIYAHHADQYHRLIAAEDVGGQLLAALLQAADLERSSVLDLGSGTGRIPLLLHSTVKSVLASDLSGSMLRHQADLQARAGGAWPLVCADMRAAPFPAGSFDVVTAGWVIGHLTGWHPGGWRTQVNLALKEMHRLVRVNGTLIILETLGTGVDKPSPPTAQLAAYYAVLESAWGFNRRVIRTDYRFEDLPSAAELAGFFFGPELRARIESLGWTWVPEFTGVWSKKVD